MLRLERFQVDDLLFIQPRPPQVYPGFLNALQAERGMGLTAWSGAQPVGAAGITRWPLVFEGWVYISEYLARQPMWFHRMVKLHFPVLLRAMRVDRLYVRVDPELPPSWRRWPRALGLTFVGRNEDEKIDYWEGLFPYGRNA